MKLKIIPILLILTSCSSTSNYIIDPRASKEPKEIIRDKLECRELAKPYLEAKHQRLLGVVPFCTSAECMAWGQPNFDPFKKCLVNRGHSIIN